MANLINQTEPAKIFHITTTFHTKELIHLDRKGISYRVTDEPSAISDMVWIVIEVHEKGCELAEIFMAGKQSERTAWNKAVDKTMKRGMAA